MSVLMCAGAIAWGAGCAATAPSPREGTRALRPGAEVAEEVGEATEAMLEREGQARLRYASSAEPEGEGEGEVEAEPEAKPEAKPGTGDEGDDTGGGEAKVDEAEVDEAEVDEVTDVEAASEAGEGAKTP